MAENRSHEATPRRRQKAREQGRVARGRELAPSLAVATVIFVSAWQIQHGVVQWRSLLRHLLAGSENVNPLTGFVALNQVAMCWMYPALGSALAIAVAGTFAQGGVVVAPTQLKPQLNRLSPASHLQQLFSSATVVSLLKSLIPTSLIVYFVVQVLTRDWTVLCASPQMKFPSVWSQIGLRLFEVGWKSGLVLLGWASLDFLLQKQKFERDLRMTNQEVREEAKESEGNPQVKARIRKLQRQVRRKRMLEDVARATVVITNPTEYAIALEYNDRFPAPIVVAKGRNLLAQQIKQAARWHAIPAIENVPLAHSLYRTVEVGQAIPAKLYAAVAEVLAFILRAQARVVEAR